jgi:diguanylate cyclase (GGDEF)-like protein
MTTGPLAADSPADRSGGHRFALDHVAQQLTSAVAGDEMLVLALHPNGDDRRVVASAGNSAIRAAVSVAVAAGNTRAWAEAKQEAVVAIDMSTLPEIIRAAVLPTGVISVHVATVEDAGVAMCLVMWLSTEPGSDGDLDQSRHEVLARLHEAVLVDRQQTEAAIELAAQQAARTPVARVADIDVLESLPDADRFDEILDELHSDATGLLVVAIDDHAELLAGGDAVAATVVRTVATRLVEGCRKADVVARIADDTFAVLLVDVDRRTAFEVANRLRSHLTEAISHDGGDRLDVEFSIGLAHEVGLVDPIELFESAQSAMHEARQAGGARMLISS